MKAPNAGTRIIASTVTTTAMTAVATIPALAMPLKLIAPDANAVPAAAPAKGSRSRAQYR